MADPASPALRSVFAVALATTRSWLPQDAGAHTITLTCPGCGAPRHHERDDMRCSYCGGSIVAGRASPRRTTVPDPRVIAVLERWTRFQQQLYQRFTEILAEAEPGCAALLTRCDDDPAAMSNAWTAVHARAVDLGRRLHDTWSDQVQPRLDELDAGVAVEDQARAELDALADRMEIELEAARLRVFAGAARSLWARARPSSPASLPCTQCGAPIPVPASFQAVNVPCPSCRALVTYEPGARVRMIEHFCVHPLCEEAAWDQWLAMRHAEQRLHASREETLDLLQAYERAQITYWHAYLSARVGMLPRTAEAFDADLRGKMQQWYEQVAHRSAWARAGRPRALP